MTIRFVIERQRLDATRWAYDDPVAPLPEGSVRLAIDRFALTANNITYAAFGDAMKYWSFFPTGDAATGCLPVWGFADVAESRCDGVAVGERFYGYFPIANDVVLQPARVNASGFVDGAAHRRELHPLYNHYVRCTADPGYERTREGEQALLRPLFTTSFLIDDFLADNDFFGAGAVLLSSASSKTAYGTAFCLSRRRATAHPARAAGSPRLIGLTSPAHVAFTHGLGCYDEVRVYDDVGSLPGDAATVYVDFSGSASLRMDIHRHFGDRLRYSCSVGGTHWDALGGGSGLPGPRPTLFFAPAQAKKRMADWGSAAFQQRLGDAWASFILKATAPEAPWLRVVQAEGVASIESTYASLLSGRADPAEGHVLSFGEVAHDSRAPGAAPISDHVDP